MKKTFSLVWSVICLCALLIGLVYIFFVAMETGTVNGVKMLVGTILSFILAPTLHEMGHVIFAKASTMECQYVKFFCFKFQRKKGKMRFSFVSPFAPDETRVIPKNGNKMKNRVVAYTLGGLVLQGLTFFALLLTVIWVGVLGRTSYLLLAMIPYMSYLFLMNVVPLEYPSGKTDCLVLLGIKQGWDVEKTMLSVFEIHGQLYEGKSFSQIDKALYFNLPQLSANEPLFSIVLDLRYRYYLEKNQIEQASDCLNRLTQAEGYLSEEEVEKIGAEFTYIHSLLGDWENAEACGKICRKFLSSDSPTAKRVLAMYSKAFGDKQAVPLLIAQAEEGLKLEPIEGFVKAERILLKRLQEDQE